MREWTQEQRIILYPFFKDMYEKAKTIGIEKLIAGGNIGYPYIGCKAADHMITIEEYRKLRPETRNRRTTYTRLILHPDYKGKTCPFASGERNKIVYCPEEVKYRDPIITCPYRGEMYAGWKIIADIYDEEQKRKKESSLSHKIKKFFSKAPPQ